MYETFGDRKKKREVTEKRIAEYMECGYSKLEAIELVEYEGDLVPKARLLDNLFITVVFH